MSGISRWWFERNIKNEHTVKHYFQDSKNQTIGIIVDKGINETAINLIKKNFQNTKFTFEQLVWTAAPLETDEGLSFSDKEVKWPGIPKSTQIERFLNQQFDVAYFLIQSESLVMEYLVRCTKATIKLGFHHKAYERYFDFSAESGAEDDIEKTKFLITSSNKLLF